MKTHHFFGSLFLVIFFFAVTSCNEKNYKMVTHVNKNGSVKKEIFAHADSAFLAGDQSCNPFPFPLDTNYWKLSLLENRNSVDLNKHYNVKISKNQKNIKSKSPDLQENNTQKIFILPQETLKKDFKWFHTIYSYTGKYNQISSRKILIPVDKYMSKQEQKCWFQGDFSDYNGLNGMELKDELDEMENHFFIWFSRNIYEASFITVLHFYDLSENKQIFSPHFTSIKDSLFQINSKDIENKNFQPVDICNMLDNYYKTTYFSVLYKKEEQAINTFYNNNCGEDEDDLFNTSIEYDLILPGTVTNTNAKLIKQDTLSWKIDALRLISNDYTLSAESCVTNTWAYIVTFALVLVAIACTLIALRMKRNLKNLQKS